MESSPSSNPYLGPGGTIVLLKSWVVYADVLGWKSSAAEEIKRDGGLKFLVRTQQAMSKALKELRRAAKPELWADSEMPPRYAVKTFTDNLVIGVPWRLDRDDGEHELGLILDQTAALQLQLACDGLFVRGGLAAGAHYMDEDFVFGAALVEAVEADVPGGPPVIVATESAKRAIRQHLSYYSTNASRPHDNHIWVDATTGQWFVNYLSTVLWAWPDGPPFTDELRAHRAAIMAGMKTHRLSPKISQKYEWLAAYHNEFCASFAEENRAPEHVGELGYDDEFYPDFDPERECRLAAVEAVDALQIPGVARLSRAALV